MSASTLAFRETSVTMGSICKAAHFSFRHSSLLADWRIFLFFPPRSSRRWLIFFYFQRFTLKWTFRPHCAAAEHPVFHDSKGEKKNSGTLLAFYFLCNLRQVAFRRVREFSGRTERWARWQSSPPHSRVSCQRAKDNAEELECFVYTVCTWHQTKGAVPVLLKSS